MTPQLTAKIECIIYDHVHYMDFDDGGFVDGQEEAAEHIVAMLTEGGYLREPAPAPNSEGA